MWSYLFLLRLSIFRICRPCFNFSSREYDKLILRISSRAEYKYVGANCRPKCTLAALPLPPGESRWVCRRDRQTDGRTPDRYITLSAIDANHAAVERPVSPWRWIGRLPFRSWWMTTARFVHGFITLCTPSFIHVRLKQI